MWVRKLPCYLKMGQIINGSGNCRIGSRWVKYFDGYSRIQVYPSTQVCEYTLDTARTLDATALDTTWGSRPRRTGLKDCASSQRLGFACAQINFQFHLHANPCNPSGMIYFCTIIFCFNPIIVLHHMLAYLSVNCNTLGLKFNG